MRDFNHLKDVRTGHSVESKADITRHLDNLQKIDFPNADKGQVESNSIESFFSPNDDLGEFDQLLERVAASGLESEQKSLPRQISPGKRYSLLEVRINQAIGHKRRK